MKLLILIFSIIALFSSLVLAEVTPETYIDEKTGETVIKLPKIKYEEQTIPRGENGTLALTYFTKAYINIYEGSKLDFNIYGDSPSELIASNSLILKKVNKDHADFLYSDDGINYKEIDFYPGTDNKLQLNFTGNIPFMFVEMYKWRYLEEDAKNNRATLFFNTPIVPASKRKTPPAEGYTVINLDKVDAGEKPKDKNQIYYIAGAIAILIALLLLFKPYFKKKQEPHST